MILSDPVYANVYAAPDGARMQGRWQCKAFAFADKTPGGWKLAYRLKLRVKVFEDGRTS